MHTKSENEDGGLGEKSGEYTTSLSGTLLDAPYRCTSTGSIELVGVSEEDTPTTFQFESVYRKPKENSTLAETVKETIARKWRKFSLKRTLSANFPTMSALKHYKVRQDLPNDIVAGLTVGITMIPQGMAFASLSTLPPIVGLYISLFASLAYFVVGTCHQLSWGCVAVLSILMGNVLDSYEVNMKAAYPQFDNYNSVTSSSVPSVNTTVSPFADFLNVNSTNSSAESSVDNPLLVALSTQKKIEVAGAVTFISGIILAILGKLGLGRLTTFMSDCLITSFTVGVSFHVVSSQIKAALDLDVPRQSGLFKLIKLWIIMLSNIHHANPATIITSLTCIVVLYVVKRFVNEKFKSKLRVPVPIELFVVIIATVITAFTGLNEKYSVSIVKEVPIGVPSPRIPDLSLGKDYVAEGLVIIIVSFTQNVAMAKLMALKHNYRIESNQEMFACGIVSVVCSIFSGYISGPSVSRSMVQDGAGGKTQVASLFAAALVFLVIMLIGPYFYYLPKCVLAAIIIVNLRSIFLKMTTVPTLWRHSRVDALVWIITCAATVILGTDIGLLAGIVVCILFVLMQSQITTVDVVSEICTSEARVWKPEDKYVGGQTVGGVKVVRINSALYFANAEIMTDQVFKKTGINPIKMKKARTINVKDDDCEDAANINKQTKQTEPHNDLTDGGKIGNGQTVEKAKLAERNDINCLPEIYTLSVEAEMLIKSLVFDLSSVPFIDIMGVQALEFLIAKYEAVGIDVYFANAQEKCLSTLQKTGFVTKHKNHVFITIESALKYISLQRSM
ncbi:sulfate transporter-like [Babylonia areolata]|uniref:sulfate transporter-like n=1 Tax=Babylonia areolata TaxID=304850 RepID=UPI003FD44BD9